MDELVDMARAVSNQRRGIPRETTDDGDYRRRMANDEDARAYMGDSGSEDTQSRLEKNNRTHAGRAAAARRRAAVDPFNATPVPFPSGELVVSQPKKRPSEDPVPPARRSHNPDVHRHSHADESDRLMRQAMAAHERVHARQLDAAPPPAPPTRRAAEPRRRSPMHFDDEAEEDNDGDDGDDGGEEEEQAEEYYEQEEDEEGGEDVASHSSAASRAAAPRRVRPAAPPGGGAGDGDDDDSSDSSVGPAPGAGGSFVPMDDIRQLNRSYPNARRTTSQYCFSCRYAPGGKATDIAREGLEVINEILVTSDSGASRVGLAEAIHFYYNKYVRDEANRFARPGEERFPDWSVPNIFFHFFTSDHGRVNASESTARRIQILEKCLFVVSNNELIREGRDANGNIVRQVDTDAYLKMEKIIKLLDSQYKPAPGKKAGFGSNVATVPTENASGVFQRPIQLYGQGPGGNL